MNVKGPIFIIDDDEDDRHFLNEAFKKLSLQNEVVFFSDSRHVIPYLKNSEVKPFIIFSDINMPGLNGLQLRDLIVNDKLLSLVCTPWLFLSTSGSREMVTQAYTKSLQGYFVKPNSIDLLVSLLQRVIDYWLICKSPELPITLV